MVCRAAQSPVQATQLDIIIMPNDKPLGVTVERDGRVEITAAGDESFTLLLEPDAERVTVSVFVRGTVLIGQLAISSDGVEVIQADRLRGVYVEWSR